MTSTVLCLNDFVQHYPAVVDNKVLGAFFFFSAFAMWKSFVCTWHNLSVLYLTTTTLLPVWRYDNGDMSILLHVFWYTYVCILLAIKPGVEFLDYEVAYNKF